MTTHRSMRWRRRSVAAAAAASMLVAACSDGPSTGPTSPGLRSNTVPIPPQTTRVCKVGPAGTYHFEAVSGEGLGTFLVGTPVTLPNGISKQVSFTLAAGECKDVYQNSILMIESFFVREVGPLPTGVTLEKITWQTLAFLGFPDGPLNTVTGVNEIRLEPFAKPFLVTFYNKGEDTPPGSFGCTPGFWKNSTGSWPPTGYATGADYDATFGVNMFNPNITLLQAAGLGGGGKNALARHSVAGILNAAHPDVDYPISAAAVIAGVQAAAASGSFEIFKDALESWNETECTLSNDNSFK